MSPPTARGAACAASYTLALALVTLVALAPVPRAFDLPARAGLLRIAGWSGRRVDWAAHGWLDRTRRWLGTDPRFRAFTSVVLDDALASLDPAGYATTARDRAGVDELGRRLADRGFRRNATAYLKYRERGGRREYERSSWVLRERVDADRQLHLRLFEGPRPGTVDVYAHWEPSVVRGAEHYGRPDYPTGVAMARTVLDAAGVSTDRHAALADGSPACDPGDASPPVRRE